MEFPICPHGQHRGSVVSRAGWYGRDGQKRQRWWCVPETEQRHRFTETLPRIVAQTGERHTCPHCTTQLEPWEGQPAPRLYGFTAQHVTAALVRVARGASYRSTAASIRTAAGRELERKPGKSASGKALPPPTQHGQLVADWVDTFAPVLWNHLAPKEWSARVIADEDEVRHGSPGTGRGVKAFTVLATYGYTPLGRGYVTTIEAVPKLSSSAWVRHLGQLSGTPEAVVTDGGRAVMGGVARAWPAAELRRCEYHLAKNLGDVLPREVSDNKADPLHLLLARAQRSPEAWAAFHDEVMARDAARSGYAGLAKRTAAMDHIVRSQSATRGAKAPHSTGPLEQFFHQMSGVIGDRAAQMTNKRRADALLMLIAASQNGWVDELKWADIIRTHLATWQGRPLDQRRHTDPAGSPSLR